LGFPPKGKTGLGLNVVLLSGACRGQKRELVYPFASEGEFSMIAISPTPTELPPTPTELADFIKWIRETNKWTQATLAEIAGVTERTIQRVENAEPSSLDTRRALARAFGSKDLDIFEKPWPRPDPEKLKAEMAESDAVAITRIREGRTLRTMVEGASA